MSQHVGSLHEYTDPESRSIHPSPDYSRNISGSALGEDGTLYTYATTLRGTDARSTGRFSRLSWYVDLAADERTEMFSSDSMTEQDAAKLLRSGHTDMLDDMAALAVRAGIPFTMFDDV